MMFEKYINEVLYKYGSSQTSNAAQHSVHPTSGILRVFQAVFWLQVFSAFKPYSHSAHLRVTHTVGQPKPHLGLKRNSK